MGSAASAKLVAGLWARVRQHRTPLSGRLLQAPCFRLLMYCGRRRIEAMIIAQVSSAGA